MLPINPTFNQQFKDKLHTQGHKSNPIKFVRVMYTRLLPTAVSIIISYQLPQIALLYNIMYTVKLIQFCKRREWFSLINSHQLNKWNFCWSWTVIEVAWNGLNCIQIFVIVYGQFMVLIVRPWLTNSISSLIIITLKLCVLLLVHKIHFSSIDWLIKIDPCFIYALIFPIDILNNSNANIFFRI